MPLRSESDRGACYTAVPSVVDALSDEDLSALNAMLPWAAYTLDIHGRRLGRAHSPTKRSTPQVIPDARIVEFDRRYGLSGRRVLEIGCFEGIHTVALARAGAVVLAVDGRIESFAKTALRCALYGVQVELGVWDVEGPAPADIDVACDLLHHVGVLYHLADPIEHLAYLLPLVEDALMLDSHVATPGSATEQYVSRGRSHAYQPYREGGRLDPFSGMRDHAKWLPEDALVSELAEAGFEVDDLERRDERNGPRVRILARRTRTPAD